jgi:hypothetical protein
MHVRTVNERRSRPMARPAAPAATLFGIVARR